MRSLAAIGFACVASGETINDQFQSRDSSVWDYADGESHWDPKHETKVRYMLNHSAVDAKLSQNEGHGLQLIINDQPCRSDTNLCDGAKMASDHLKSVNSHSYGDYEARIRAPHNYPGDSSKCDNGIYGYFTAGYSKKGSDWNEMNFGFHPDRDTGGTKVSAELHADTGGYHETTVTLGFNYREAFHTYRIKHRPCDVSWWVDGKCVHVMDECLTHEMKTSIILRTNHKDEFMSQAKMELSYFKFTPFSQGSEAIRPTNQTVAEAIAWHEAQEHGALSV
eukprot:TRINITY_DN69979_c0_g1_i1.p1 TRINITY_DN69979_c0_g1~~TRINITY_DN69979_c0_g1_i1.p1  ORF type:complete len:279 (+),score=41.42 TRINITY_DN69979_c0_g1_i1:116-952(+)